MANTPSAYPSIHFPQGYKDRLEDEAPQRGYLSDVIVEVPEGMRYQVFFIDLVRLSQDLPRDLKCEHPYFAEPGLIVLPTVTTEAIQKAVRGLWEEGFFEDLKPL